jgi:DNA-directed RNA polymerase specialized sigma24 family protein
MESAELIEMLKKKNQKAISILYDQYAPVLYGAILRIVKSQLPAELILEQTFLRIAEQVHSYNGQTTFFTWMFVIARKTALEYATLNTPKAGEGGMFTPPDLKITEDQSKLLVGMDPQCREVLNHIYFQGHSILETSEALKIPEGKVRSQLRYAFEHMSGKINTEPKTTR